VTTEICARRLSVLPVDQDAAAFEVEDRSRRLTTVDLPAPERPIRPIFSPGRTINEKPSSTA
jgi:hypothetical protein